MYKLYRIKFNNIIKLKNNIALYEIMNINICIMHYNALSYKIAIHDLLVLKALPHICVYTIV